MRAVRASANGDLTPTDTSGTLNPGVAWEKEKTGNYMQTPIAVGPLLFACADTGVVTCFDAKTGEVRYTERLAPMGEGYTASPVSDGKHLYFTSELGNVFVVPATDKFAVTAKNALGETCLATPAISDGAMFFRTSDKLVAVGMR
jgi:outer membrane protein assembly factor BamB